MRVVILEKEVESCKDCPHCNFSFALFKRICCHPEFEINDLRKPEVSGERIPEGCPFLNSESVGG